MKTKRYKNAYKILTHFKYHHKITPPYRILVDGPFCWAALQNKINLREQIPKYLDAEAEIVTTKCVLQELEKLGSRVHGAAVVCKQFHIDHCPHKNDTSARDCMLQLAKKARKDDATKYIIGTQDDVLKEKLRNLKSTPILFIAFNAILFDKLTEEAKQSVTAQEELDKVKEMRKELLGEVAQAMKKKKKKKGKNPLSCKKKIVKETLAPQRTGDRTASGKRRRKKKNPVDTTRTETA